MTLSVQPMKKFEIIKSWWAWPTHKDRPSCPERKDIMTGIGWLHKKSN